MSIDGIFSWFDFNANDVSKAKAFYGEVVGWSTKSWGDDGYELWMLSDEQSVGGVVELPEEARAMGLPPFWLAFISTDDADAAAQRTQELGGEIAHGPFDVPTVGRAAVLRDPQGAVFGVVSFEDDMAPPSPATPGAFSWGELMTTSWKDALGFYSELFGWKAADALDMGDKGTYQMFDTAAGMRGGMMNLTPEMPMAAWLYYITTDDIEAAVQRASNQGAQTIAAPMTVPGGGRIAVLIDNQGGAFGLYEGGDR